MGTFNINEFKSSLFASKGKGSSIYKAEIFSGLIADDRKAMRKKIRRFRNKFLGVWAENRNKPKEVKAPIFEQLFTEWEEFATGVYLNKFKICEDNTNNEDARLCAEFSADFGAWLNSKEVAKKETKK